MPFASHVSCTIEMASTTNEYEVAVIDEIQMLADEQRGPSWTAVSRVGSAEGGGGGRTRLGNDFELKQASWLGCCAAKENKTSWLDWCAAAAATMGEGGEGDAAGNLLASRPLGFGCCAFCCCLCRKEEGL